MFVCFVCKFKSEIMFCKIEFLYLCIDKIERSLIS